MEVENSSEDIVQESELEMASHYINPRAIWDLFYDIYNGNEFACAGALGNMQVESGFYSDNAENKWNRETGKTDEWLTDGINTGEISLQEFLQTSWYVNDWGFGYGLSQWTDATRRTKLWDYTVAQGIDIDSQSAQFDYIRWEWLNPDSHYHQYLADMRGARSIYEGTYIYCKKYEVGSWTDKRLTNAEHWYNEFAHSGTTTVFVNYTGNGYAYTDNPTAQVGESFTIYATPNGEDRIENIEGTTEGGQSIAMGQGEVETYTYQQAYGSYITVNVTFTGETPPEPPTPKKKEHHLPIWMYPYRKQYLC